MGSDKLKRTEERMTKKRPLERQKMRPWLLEMLAQGKTQGLEWFDESQNLFKINWKHGSRHGFNTRKDASLFEKYAQHTGRWDPQDPNPKKWKANFRCALNSLQNVMEIKKLGESKGVHAFRVYQFLDEEQTKPKEGNSRKSNKEKTEKEKPRKILSKFVQRESKESDNEDCSVEENEQIEIPTSTSGGGEETAENDPQYTKPEVRKFTFQNHMAGCVVRIVPRKRPMPYVLEDEDKDDPELMTSEDAVQTLQHTAKRRRRSTDDESMTSYTQPSVTTDDESSNDSNCSVSSSSSFNAESRDDVPNFSGLFTNILDDDWEVEKEETVTTTQNHM